MPCYHPLIAWENSNIKTKNGKSKIFFKPPKPEDLKNWKQILLPCGQCIGCRLDYSKEWAIRCVLEKKEYEHNYFLTLTYSPEHTQHLYKIHINKSTGEVENEYLDLNPEDLTKFMKDIRRYYEYHFKWTNIRFFACGEYGDEKQRPHFHIIMFNFPVPDLKPWFINKEHMQVYTSEIISKVWGKGLVAIGEVTYQSAAYVARYITKKQKGKDAENFYKTPQFVRMSRMPGIASAYYERNKEEIYKNDEIIIGTKIDKVVSVKPPGYFDKLYDEIEPDKLSDIKETRRKSAQRIRANQERLSTYTTTKALEVKERYQAQKALALKRELREDV